MKIGIITVQKAPENYGACLQCYALWKYLCYQGYDCEVIDLTRPWSPNYIRSTRFHEKKDPVKTSVFGRIKLQIHNMLHSKKHNIPVENSMFKSFNALMKYSQTYNSVDELYDNPPQYDVYISGSDQIWNPNMPFINEPYFLTFVPKGKRKLSYASSFAIKDLTIDRWANYEDWLKDFYRISVRETSGVDIVKKQFGREAVTVLDPTMLLSREDWEKELIEPADKEKYVLVYTLQYNPEIVNAAVKIARDINAKVKVIVSSTTNAMNAPSEVEVCEAGPKEWMGYIHNAGYILTDSFHGSVFSIIFGKTFVTVCTNNKVSERLTTLFNTFSLTNNLIGAENLSLPINIDDARYDREIVNFILDNKRNESQSFLINALK